MGRRPSNYPKCQARVKRKGPWKHIGPPLCMTRATVTIDGVPLCDRHAKKVQAPALHDAQHRRVRPGIETQLVQGVTLPPRKEERDDSP